jgi:hypothetical protein
MTSAAADTKWYSLDITCATCQAKGKTTILGAILASVPIQEKALDEFLSNHNNAVFICNKCSEIMEYNAKSMTGTKK